MKFRKCRDRKPATDGKIIVKPEEYIIYISIKRVFTCSFSGPEVHFKSRSEKIP